MKMDWLRMERRMRDALQDYSELTPTLEIANEFLVRLDMILASETRRGNAIHEESLKLLVPPQLLTKIEDTEWGKVGVYRK